MDPVQDSPGAAAVAAVPARVSAPVETTRQCLLFEVAGGRYGLWSSVVRETLRAVAIAPLPGAPPAVLGAIDLRGRVIPVFGLRERFHLPAKAVDVTDHLVVVAAGDRVAALLVDRAVGLVDVTARDMESADGVTPAAGYLEGIVRMPDGLILIHDPATFLSRAEAAGLDASLAVPA